MFSTVLFFCYLCFLQTIVCDSTQILKDSQSRTPINPGFTCNKTKVAVLGAGMAGITAAKALSATGIHDFVILEYRSDIGGRLSPIKFGNKTDGTAYLLEQGAAWIRGTGDPRGRSNPVYFLAEKYDLAYQVSDPTSLRLYDWTGPDNWISFLETFEKAWKQVKGNSSRILSEGLEDHSLRAALRIAGWDPHKYPADFQKLTVEWYALEYRLGYTPEESSALFSSVAVNSTENQFSKDNLFVTDQRGFNTILKGEASEFLTANDSRLVLQAEVMNISLADPTKVIIEAIAGDWYDGPDGPTKLRCWEAEYVINTFSLATLQRGWTTLFNPSLPKWKRDAIHTMQMGLHTKIFMQFPPDQVFWDKKNEFMLYSSRKRGWYPVFQNLDHPKLHPGSGILIATVTGELAWRLDDYRTTNEDAKKEIMEVLYDMFGAQLPEPTNFYYYQSWKGEQGWDGGNWIAGSFSSWPPGMTIKQHQNLRANVNRLWFAGEANSANYFGTLQGAWFEGNEIGNRVASRLNGVEESGKDLVRYEDLKGPNAPEDFNDRNGFCRQCVE